jgi:hypothetical protein
MSTAVSLLGEPRTEWYLHPSVPCDAASANDKYE